MATFWETIGARAREAEVATLRRDLEQARLRIAALEQALATRQPALDEAYAKIVKYRLEIVGLRDALAKGG